MLAAVTGGRTGARAVYPKWDTRRLTSEEGQQYEANLARWLTREEQEPPIETALQQATLVWHVAPASTGCRACGCPLGSSRGYRRRRQPVGAPAGGRCSRSRKTRPTPPICAAGALKQRQRLGLSGCRSGSLRRQLAQAELDELHELVEDRVDASPPPLPLADLSKVEQWASLKAGKHQETCELQEWRAKAKERRPAVLAKLGAQIAAAVGLLQSFFKQFVSIAANDPDMTSLHFEEYESWPLTMPAGEADSLRGTTENSEHVSALLACFADCLAGNTFLRGFDMSMCLPYHQYAWAAASHAQFRRLVTQCNTAG
jgi:hypothetical protein